MHHGNINSVLARYAVRVPGRAYPVGTRCCTVPGSHDCQWSHIKGLKKSWGYRARYHTGFQQGTHARAHERRSTRTSVKQVLQGVITEAS